MTSRIEAARSAESDGSCVVKIGLGERARVFGKSVDRPSSSAANATAVPPSPCSCSA